MTNYLLALKRPFTNPGYLFILILLYFLANAISNGSLLIDSSTEITSIKIIGAIISSIISIIAIGYSIKCAETAMKKKYSLPSWKNIQEITMLGIKSFILVLIYLIPLIAIIYFSGISVDLQLLSKGTITLQEISATLVIIILIGIITVLLIPIAIMEFIEKNSIKNAFDLKSIAKKAIKMKYLSVFIVSILYITLLNIIFGGLSLLTLNTIFLPWLLNAISSSISAITAMTLYGLVFKEIS